MKTNAYLYGEKVVVEEIPNEIIMRRLELLKDNLAELLDQSYHIRDCARCNAVLKTIKFWENINKENK